MAILNSAPKLLKSISSQLIWDIEPKQNEYYLTFDDGPHPTITPWVLDTLKQFEAKGTFFLVGENAAKYPEIVKRIIDEGHHIGNHTYNHLQGWSSNSFKYYKNTLKCEEFFTTTLFRPPHGRITPGQHRRLAKKFSIVMWSVLSGDYDRQNSPQNIIEQVVNYTQPGSVIVFHDSEKAEHNLRNALPQVIKNLLDKNLESHAIPYQIGQSSEVRGEGVISPA